MYESKLLFPRLLNNTFPQASNDDGETLTLPTKPISMNNLYQVDPTHVDSPNVTTTKKRGSLVSLYYNSLLDEASINPKTSESSERLIVSIPHPDHSKWNLDFCKTLINNIPHPLELEKAPKALKKLKTCYSKTVKKFQHLTKRELPNHDKKSIYLSNLTDEKNNLLLALNKIIALKNLLGPLTSPEASEAGVLARLALIELMDPGKIQEIRQETDNEITPKDREALSQEISLQATLPASLPQQTAVRQQYLAFSTAFPMPETLKGHAVAPPNDSVKDFCAPSAQVVQHPTSKSLQTLKAIVDYDWQLRQSHSSENAGEKRRPFPRGMHNDNASPDLHFPERQDQSGPPPPHRAAGYDEFKSKRFASSGGDRQEYPSAPERIHEGHRWDGYGVGEIPVEDLGQAWITLTGDGHGAVTGTNPRMGNEKLVGQLISWDSGDQNLQQALERAGEAYKNDIVGEEIYMSCRRGANGIQASPISNIHAGAGLITRQPASKIPFYDPTRVNGGIAR